MGCVEDSKVYAASLFTDPAIKRDMQLRPYLRRRGPRLLSPDKLRLRGNVVVAAWRQLVFVVVYVVGTSFLIANIIEPMYPTLLVVENPFTTWSLFFTTFFLSGAAFGATSKYSRAINAAYETLNSIQAITVYFTASIVRSRLKRMVWTPSYPDYVSKDPITGNPCALDTGYGPPDNPLLRQTQAVVVVEEVQDLLRALPYVIKHNFRTQPAVSVYDDSVPADVNLQQPGVQIELLPMRKSLIRELARYETDAIGGVLAMIFSRTSLFVEAGVLGGGEYTGIDEQLNKVMEQRSAVEALQVLGLAPPYKDILRAGLWITAFLLPFDMWDDYGYATIPFYTLAMVFLFGIFGLGSQIGNPFNRASCSPYIYHDIGALVNSAARNVDDMFDKTIAEGARYVEREKDTAPCAPVANRLAADTTTLSHNLLSSGQYSIR